MPACLRPSYGKRSRVAAGPLIAIVDDDESMLSALVALVRSVGHVPRAFTSAEAFLESGTAASYACIITDVQMPGMNGFALTQELAARQILDAVHHDHCAA